MHVPPQIQALRNDPALLRQAQERHNAAFEVWAGAPEQAALFAAFTGFARGEPLARLPALAALFDSQHAVAGDLVASLCDALLPVLAAEPFGQIPLRHWANRTAAAVLLAQERDAALTLVAFDGATLARAASARSVSFSPAEEWDIVLTGAGRGRLVERSAAGDLIIHPLDLLPGVSLGREARTEALLIDAADPLIVVLRLRRVHAGPDPVREYDLGSGTLLHQSASRPRESRHEVAVSLLGRMGRADAAPQLAMIAGERERGDNLRWHALRELLGLDTALGFRTLIAIARSGDDPLAAPAGALRAHLLELHPALGELEPCRA